MIGLDLDGTALNSKKELTPGVAAAIADAVQAGVVVLPVTGRGRLSIPPEINSLCRYEISANGADARDTQTGELLFRDCFDTPTALELLSLCEQANATPGLVMDGQMYSPALDYDALSVKLNPDLISYLKVSRQPVEDMAAFVRQSLHPVEKFSMLFYDLADRPAAIKLFQGRGDCAVSWAVATNLELNTPTANKGAALLRLAGLLGVPKEGIMAMGDFANDLDMLRAVGWPVAMGNAIPELKQVARAVTKSCDEDGVAVAIRAALAGSLHEGML